MIDYMEEGNNYIRSKSTRRKGMALSVSYSDSYTSGLSYSIRNKAKQIIEKKDIRDVLKSIILS